MSERSPASPERPTFNAGNPCPRCIGTLQQKSNDTTAWCYNCGWFPERPTGEPEDESSHTLADHIGALEALTAPAHHHTARLIADAALRLYGRLLRERPTGAATPLKEVGCQRHAHPTPSSELQCLEAQRGAATPSDAAKHILCREMAKIGDLCFDWDKPPDGSYGNDDEQRRYMLEDADRVLREIYAVDHPPTGDLLEPTDEQVFAAAAWWNYPGALSDHEARKALAHEDQPYLDAILRRSRKALRAVRIRALPPQPTGEQ